MLYKINFKDFLEKVKWNITDESHIKVMYESVGDTLIFCLPCPEADYCTTIKKNELSKIDEMELNNKIIPGIIIKDKKEAMSVNIQSINVPLDKKSIRLLKHPKSEMNRPEWDGWKF